MKNKLFYYLLLGIPHSAFGILTIEDLVKKTQLPAEILKPIIVKLDELEKLERVTFGVYYSVMPNLIKKFNLKIGCEVGVSCGLHSYEILKTTPVTKLYSVDPYRAFGNPINSPIQQQFDVWYYKVHNKLSVFGARSVLLRATSLEASHSFKQHELDFIFLDADHTYEAVKEDLVAWYDKIRPGGIFAGDDYATVHPGVPQAVNEFFSAKNIKVNLDKNHPRIWWIQKPIN